MKKLTKLQQICPYCHSYADEEKLDVSPNGDCGGKVYEIGLIKVR